MKRSSLMYVLAALSLACSGGGDICSRAPDLTTGLLGKAAPCLDGGVPVIVLPPTSQCEAQLAKCTSEDQSKLNSFADCLSGLPTCQPSTELTWGTMLLTCVTYLQGVSQACQGFGFPDGGL